MYEPMNDDAIKRLANWHRTEYDKPTDTVTVPLEMQKDCSTCTYRTMPNDVDWTNTPCEDCVLVHMGGGGKPWPFWSQRSSSQFRSDAEAGHKVKIRPTVGSR
jgi:hypothetical protein